MSRRFAAMAAVTLAGVAFAACAPVMVGSFVERGADLRNYHTYGWAEDQLVTGDPRLDNNPFFLERLQAGADRYLASKRLERIDGGTPDLLLHYHASVTQRLEVTRSDQTHGDCRDCKPDVYDQGTLLFDFIDARTHRLVWRGWAQSSLDGVVDDQEWMEQTIDKAVARIMARLPLGE